MAGQPKASALGLAAMGDCPHCPVIKYSTGIILFSFLMAPELLVARILEMEVGRLLIIPKI